MKYNLRFLVFLLFTGLIFSACSPTTSITGAWHEPTFQSKGFKHIMVLGITDNNVAKQVVENEFATKMQLQGVKVTKAGDVFPPTLTQTAGPTKEMILAKLQELNCDGIITTALVNEKTETKYIPGNNTYAPGMGYYNNWGSYYGYGYNAYSQPGYYTQDKVYFLESNLYDTASEKLIWSAQSKTYNPASIEKFSKEYTTVIIRQLIKDKVLFPVPAK